MRRLLFAGAAAAALLVWSTPAHAGITDNIRDALEEPFEDLFAYLEFMITKAENLPEYLITREINSFMDAVGFNPRSWLANWGDLRDMYPEKPVIYTVMDAVEASLERYEDRTTRVEEAMQVAGGITEAAIPNQMRLEALRAMNTSPVGMLAADQVRNEILLNQAGSLEKLAILTAELGQLEADERVKEDHVQQVIIARTENHYGENGMWAGTKTWTPETMGIR